MNDETERAEALLKRMAFQLARWSEMNEATNARMQSTLARAGEIQEEQKRMGEAITKIEQKFS